MDINIHNIRNDNVKTIIWVYICTNNSRRRNVYMKKKNNEKKTIHKKRKEEKNWSLCNESALFGVCFVPTQRSLASTFFCFLSFSHHSSIPSSLLHLVIQNQSFEVWWYQSNSRQIWRTHCSRLRFKFYSRGCLLQSS